MIQWVFRDLMLCLLLTLLGIVMISNQQPIHDDASIKPPGNLIVTITWPDGNDDVDLWLFGPGEDKPIGFTHKDGNIWNLLRDDLGTEADDVGINYENAFSRGTPAGEYIVNIFAFHINTGFPKEVKYEVKMNTPGGQVVKIASGTVILHRPKEEVTAVSFTLDAHGNLVEGSVLNIYKPLVYKDETPPT